MKRCRLAGMAATPWVSERRLSRDLWRILSYIHEANAVIRNNLHKEMENCPWTHSSEGGSGNWPFSRPLSRCANPESVAAGRGVVCVCGCPSAKWRGHASKRGLNLKGS